MVAAGGRMASEHSYTITLNNNRTEKAAIDYVIASDSRFWVPAPSSRKQILAEMDLDPSYSRAFDLVLTDDGIGAESQLAVRDIRTVTLVELKTTRKYLPESPRGFFFGATQNEFDLAAALGDRYSFCFVCLHPDALGYRLLTLAQLEPLIRTKRTQYQINL
jgi:hypothetical protein